MQVTCLHFILFWSIPSAGHSLAKSTGRGGSTDGLWVAGSQPCDISWNCLSSKVGHKERHLVDSCLLRYINPISNQTHSEVAKKPKILLLNSLGQVYRITKHQTLPFIFQNPKILFTWFWADNLKFSFLKIWGGHCAKWSELRLRRPNTIFMGVNILQNLLLLIYYVLNFIFRNMCSSTDF